VETAIPIDPDITAALDATLLRDGFRLTDRSLDDALALLRARGAGAQPPPPPGLHIEDGQIGAGHDIPIRIYTPRERRPRGVIVNIHGGGWVAGSIDGDDPRCRIIAEQAGCVLVSVGYRLAPEHPFPRGLEDCAAALAWAHDNAEALGAPARKVAVIGFSAGANLAAAAMLKLAVIDGSRLPAFHILLYPICDVSLAFPSYSENAAGYFLTRRDMIWYWEQYMGAADGSAPLASILRAANLAQLPPGLIVTSEYDPLRDEGEAFADRLNALGVPTERIRYPGAIHGFVSLAPQSRLTADALRKMIAALEGALGRD
jgi:acetyl esterase